MLERVDEMLLIELFETPRRSTPGAALYLDWTPEQYPCR